MKLSLARLATGTQGSGSKGKAQTRERDRLLLERGKQKGRSTGAMTCRSLQMERHWLDATLAGKIFGRRG